MRRLLTALAILASLVVPASAQIVWPSGGSGSGGGAATSIDAGGATAVTNGTNGQVLFQSGGNVSEFALGTGVQTALGINVGSAGAFVTFGGALGSPSSAGTLPAFTLGGTVAGGGNQLNNVIIGTTSPLLGSFTTLKFLQPEETAVALSGCANSTATMDLTTGSYFYCTVSAGAVTFAVSNAASSGLVSSFTLELTNGGSQTLSWMSGTKWPGGTAPTLTASGVDLLVCSTRDAATTWRCALSEPNSH